MDHRVRFRGILNGMGLSASVQKALAFEEMIRRAAPDAVDALLDRLENLAAQIREQARLADEAQRAMQGETTTMEALAREQATQFLITQQLDPDRALQIRKLVDELLAARDRRDEAQERVRKLRREFQELLDRFAAAHGAPRLEVVMEAAG